MSLKSVFLHLTRVWLSGGRWVVLLGLLGVLSWVYTRTFLQGCPSITELCKPHEMEQRHLTMTMETAQDLRLDFSQSMSRPLNDWLPHHTDGLVRPLWPWMAAWLMDETEESTGAAGYSPRFAQRSHLAKLSFSLSILILLGLACARAFSVPAAVLTVFLTGFGVFLPSGRFFLPDLLFSVLFLMTWVCCIAALKRNSLWLYGVIGFLAALANLTAPTATPLMLVFVCVSTLRWFWGWIMEHFTEDGGTTLWVRRNHWLGVILLIVCHLVTAGPMLSHAYQKLGDATPFHWRWFEDADGFRSWTATHQTLETLRSVPEDQMPSFENYRSSHSTEEILGRLSLGAVTLLKNLLPFDWAGTFPRGGFVAVFAGLLVLLGMMVAFVGPRAHHVGQALHPETAPIVLFTLLALGVGVFDFGWDLQVLDFGNRVLALYAPLVLSLMWACEALVQRLRRRQMQMQVFFLYQVVLWLLCAAAFWWLIAFLQPASSTA